jgi:hypothetical protein
MHVLIIIVEEAVNVLVKLESAAHIDEIKTLIRESKRASAIQSVLTKGKLVRELTDEESPHIDADLTLTKNGAYWNMM